MFLRFIVMREDSTEGGCLMFAVFFLALSFFMLVGGFATGDMKAGFWLAGAVLVIGAVLGLWSLIVSIKEK